MYIVQEKCRFIMNSKIKEVYYLKIPFDIYYKFNRL
jgi:hypothetical protein